MNSTEVSSLAAHNTSSLSEVSEWELAEGCVSTSVVFSPRYTVELFLDVHIQVHILRLGQFCERKVIYSINCYRRHNYYNSLVRAAEQTSHENILRMITTDVSS
jgi:hypothetical protein